MCGELPVATTNDLKNGMTLNLEGQLWNVVEFQHVKRPLTRLATRRHATSPLVA